MPDHVPATDRSTGGPGSSHEDHGKTSSRTRKGDRIQPQSESLNGPHDGTPDGDAHGHHAKPDQVAKDNFKSEHGGKP